MDISANTIISSLFQPKTTTSTSAKTLNMDAMAEQFAAIEPGTDAKTAKIAATNTDIAIDAALQQDARYEQLQRTTQSRTEFITQKIAQEPRAEDTAKENTVAQDFLDYMNKSSAELWRERILESLGLTEESLAALPPEDRLAAEEKIERLIREKVEEEAERAEKENGKTKEMTDTEQQQKTSHHIGAKDTALNNDLSGLQSSNPKITHMLNLTAETTQAYASAQQNSETLEQTRQEKRERLTEERI